MFSKLHLVYLFLTSIFLVGCPAYFEHLPDTPSYEPLIMERSDFEKSIQVQASIAMENAGKIYLKDHWLFLGDTHKGFHIYDNSNPENPVAVAFLSIPGATDLAIRNEVIYVNQATDLVAFSYDVNSGTITLHKRIKKAFPQMRSPDGFFHYIDDNKVIVDWIPKK
ncbi:hypothetical protein CGC56_06455 [Capnocytophaga canimorsus]|uniref:LVIVD repeat-containing protein n=1 Tax=Capnocytophaga canimorsus TaxID=28188 RepID=A0A250G3Q2_9FLAO|nr:hypothetical protein [Capnocytophaga canimorsus]ATA91841.1 hypothetical protein CGC56_06455 [Capnocytophaga canimorsus]